MAVPRRPTRKAHQRLPTRRAAPTARPAARPVPIHRVVPARHRPPRRGLLARLLGIHIGVAVAWQKASAGDWTAYAADYSRRRAQHATTAATDTPQRPASTLP